MKPLTDAQIKTLEEIDADGYDDCTVMLPAGLVGLAKDGAGNYSYPPKVVLTNAGHAALQEARG